LPLIRCPSFDVSLVPWDFMVINNIFWARKHNMRDFTPPRDKTLRYFGGNGTYY
jgi:hypothetical protein